MKYVQINAFSYGSTGSIMFNIHEKLESQGVDSYVCWSRGRKPIDDHEIAIGSKLDTYVHALYTRLTGRVGFSSVKSTKKLIDRLNQIDPDVVHLHVLHGYYINIQELFNWLNGHHCHVIWTQHDCWAFTGHCSHFTRIGCHEWQTGCPGKERCPQLKEYPAAWFFGSCMKNYLDKKRLFTLLPTNRLEIVTPSEWLADHVRKSYLGKYKVRVKANPVNTDIFFPRGLSWKIEMGIEGKFLILGVASPWTEQKGYSEFLRMAKVLEGLDCQIVMVGLSKAQMRHVPKCIIGMERTASADYLARIYSACDLFVNPSIEETFSMTVAEAQLCGTRVLVRSNTACAEIANKETSRFVDWNFESLLNGVISEYRQWEGIKLD